MKVAGELAGLSEADLVVDIGCGDGRVNLALTNKFSKFEPSVWLLLLTL